MPAAPYSTAMDQLHNAKHLFSQFKQSEFCGKRFFGSWYGSVRTLDNGPAKLTLLDLGTADGLGLKIGRSSDDICCSESVTMRSVIGPLPGLQLLRRRR